MEAVMAFPAVASDQMVLVLTIPLQMP
jgi:hypothetical protein